MLYKHYLKVVNGTNTIHKGKYLGLICRTRIRLLKLQRGKNDYQIKVLVYSTKAYRAKKEKVSAWLIIVTGLIYAYIGCEQALKGNMPMAVVYTGYAFSNVGLYILASK